MYMYSVILEVKFSNKNFYLLSTLHVCYMCYE